MKVKIEKLVYGGSGFTQIDGKAMLVPFAAPGDEVEVEIVNDHENWCEARIVEIIEPSALRTDPKCPVFEKCGGCQWQHLSYEAQLTWKQKVLKEQLERLAGIENPKVLETMPSPKQWNYRNKIQLHVSSKGEVGFYAAKSKNVIEFDECVIADQKINEQLNKEREEFRKRDKGVSLKVEDGPAFVQINSGQNENLKKILVEWVGEVEHSEVLELYAGSGNFTFLLAEIAGHLVASDVDKRAIGIAKREQKKRDIRNIEFIASASAKAARRMTTGCDALILDPPRKGAADAIKDIIKLRPKNIFYISCDPSTLSRDIKKLLETGYVFIKSLPIDMFPQTFHVECLTHLKYARDQI